MPARLSFFWLACAFCYSFSRAESSSQLTDVTLECEVHRDAKRLDVSYSVRNGSSGWIGIFNRAQEVNAPCYVDFENGNLLLNKLVLPIPPGLEVAGRPIPYVRRLKKGEIFHEQFSLPVPIAVNNPYRRALLVSESPDSKIIANKLRQASTVTLSVGIFHSDPSFRFDPVGRAEPEIYRVWPPGPAVGRQVILSKTVRLQQSVEVLDF